MYVVTANYFIVVVKEPHYSLQIYWHPFLSVPNPNLHMSQFMGFQIQKQQDGHKLNTPSLKFTRKLLWAM